MIALPEHWNFKRRPARENMVCGPAWRFTVLTPRLIRLEYTEQGRFEDRASQRVLNRDFPPVAFTTQESETELVMTTEYLRLVYDKKRFSPQGLSITLSGGFTNKPWHYGESSATLGGTVRTLDEADGAVPLDPGLLSTQGFALLDDSDSLLLTDDQWVAPRAQGLIDLYFFGYGRDYKACLKDFFTLAGGVPLLPRYALGNWWSRYHKYTDESYRALIRRFEAEQLPFTVAVVDMDWHLVDIDPQYGSGWTGYTWNRDFFPDPEGFLAWLHEQGLRVTLNVHPAEGIRGHEECYRAMAARLGVDAEAETPIPFDCSDPAFMRSYFEEVHHPLEDGGVDFWWIDWQQGTVTKTPGLDPLWMLNHYHYLDSARRGKRPLIFSRYAGIGSHRYPVGFSGDTMVTWASLAFQPYFTATASNVGYGWWSHDIGGHMRGIHDDELMTRWVQFGVFSPINRLHSTSNQFNTKEPWGFASPAGQIIGDFLRLRHRLIPYLYSMNRRASREGEPLMQPLYYAEPYQEEAYRVPNEYYFGTEFLCCPITRPMDPIAQAASFRAWIPPGLWIDFFTGISYTGGRLLELWRGLETFPLLVKAGGIVPLTDRGPSARDGRINGVDNPTALEVAVFPGGSGAFTLWEDEGDGPLDDQSWTATVFTLDWENRRFTIAPCVACGGPPTAVLPAARDWRLTFRSWAESRAVVAIDGKPVSVATEYDTHRSVLTVHVPGVPVSSEVSVLFDRMQLAVNPIEEWAFQFLRKTRLEFDLMEAVFHVIKGQTDPAQALASLFAMDIPAPVFSALCEIATCRGGVWGPRA
ncbi:MAG: DUF4968 domain-containing protein [Spirochaetaceae bacterium]|nr:DUF4968 domain-containing protein [Spirochaetaceae bacterium]